MAQSQPWGRVATCWGAGGSWHPDPHLGGAAPGDHTRLPLASQVGPVGLAAGAFGQPTQGTGPSNQGGEGALATWQAPSLRLRLIADEGQQTDMCENREKII